ncbi:MAG: hypothetical protein AB2L20_12330 [Mangrovibacterium sp.]
MRLCIFFIVFSLAASAASGQVDNESNTPDTNSNSGINFRTIVTKSSTFFLKTKEDIKLYDAHFILRTGLLFGDFQQFQAQGGANITIYKKDKISCVPEIRLGITTKSNYANTTLNIMPIMINYRINPEITMELGAEVYFRFYSGGSATKPGIVIGSNYQLTPEILVGLRTAYYNYPFIGFTGQYLIWRGKKYLSRKYMMFRWLR